VKEIFLLKLHKEKIRKNQTKNQELGSEGCNLVMVFDKVCHMWRACTTCYPNGFGQMTQIKSFCSQFNHMN
jgi:hypothetical protein